MSITVDGQFFLLAMIMFLTLCTGQLSVICHVKMHIEEIVWPYIVAMLILGGSALYFASVLISSF